MKPGTVTPARQRRDRAAIVSLYATGLTTGEIRAHLGEIDGAEVSRDLLSRVTDRVSEELASWQSRPLGAICPVLLIDACTPRSATGRWRTGPSTPRWGLTATASGTS